MRPAPALSTALLGTLRRLGLCLVAAAALCGCTTRPDQLELTPRDHTFIGVGEELWFKALPKAENGKRFPKMQASVRWHTSDESVVTVDEVGRARSVGPGQAVLTATLDQLKYDVRVEVRVIARVEPAEKSLTLTLATDADGNYVREGRAIDATIYDTLDRRLEGLKPRLRCLDENVCRTANEQVLPVDFGTTTLELRSENATARIPVEVVPPAGAAGAR